MRLRLRARRFARRSPCRGSKCRAGKRPGDRCRQPAHRRPERRDPAVALGDSRSRRDRGLHPGGNGLDRSYENTTIRGTIVGPGAGERNDLPAAFALLPSADGKWWSNFGSLGGPDQPQVFPTGTIPVAKLDVGYLVVNREHTSARRMGTGTATRSDRRRRQPAQVIATASKSRRVVERRRWRRRHESPLVPASGPSSTASAMQSQPGSHPTARGCRDPDERIDRLDRSRRLHPRADDARADQRGRASGVSRCAARVPADAVWLGLCRAAVGDRLETRGAVRRDLLDAFDGRPVLTIAAPVGLEQAIPLLP